MKAFLELRFREIRIKPKNQTESNEESIFKWFTCISSSENNKTQNYHCLHQKSIEVLFGFFFHNPILKCIHDFTAYKISRHVKLRA